MPKKVTHADAQLILQLYDLRREAEMRKARNWVATQFWPQSADDYIKVASAVGIPENASFPLADFPYILPRGRPAQT